MRKLSTAFFAILLALCFPLSAGGAVAARAEGEPLPLNKPALELSVGESDLLTGEGAVSYESDDSSIATVSDYGVVKGVGVGKTVVRVHGSDGRENAASVEVIEKERGFDDNILISVFWPPTAEYMNGGEGDERWDEQFRYMAEADVDYLCNVTGRDRQQNMAGVPRQENSKETNLKMAAFAHKYGMRVGVADDRFLNFPMMSGADIGDIISEYANVPGVGGYYMRDEPADPMPFADVYSAIKMVDPSGYAHLNFLSIGYYRMQHGMNYMGEPIVEYYKDLLGEWLQANEDAGFPQDYLMFDLYPFDAGTGLSRGDFYENLNALREVGLEHDVKTALYLQACRGENQATGATTYRMPSPSEIRFEAMLSLAYGYKQLSYFTWFQPTNRNNENFYDAIVSAEGVPNPVTYEPIKALNREIHTLGKTLIRLDSLGVYLNGTQYGGIPEVPWDFPLQPMDAVPYTISLMRDKTDGRNYVMVVNENYSAPTEFDFFLDENLPSLQRVSAQTGELEEVTPQGRMLHVSLAAGDAVLFALPEGLDYSEEQTVDKTAANALLARVETAQEELKEKDTAALDEAVSQLKEALANPRATQKYVDALTERASRTLEELLNAKQPEEQDPGEQQPGEQEPEKDGCGGVISGGAAACLAAMLAFVLRKRNR